ncbi:MAG: transglutaminase family protein [Anaerolineae bacterium]
MNYRVIHKTEYVYQEPASLCYNEARLVPRSFERCLFTQTCLNYKILVEPTPTDYRERTDFFGNPVLYYTVRQPHRRTVITTTSHVRLSPSPLETGDGGLPLHPAAAAPWEEVARRTLTELAKETVEARQYVMNSPKVAVFPALAQFAAPSFEAGRPVLEAVHGLMTRIFETLDFVPGVTTIATPLAEVLDKRRGVCQDYAHLMVGCLRAQGLAARYISGYIETLPPPGQEKLVGADASHAWCAVYVPGLGWVDFDPTNNLIPRNQHITLGWGRDFADVTPLKGVFFSHGPHNLKVSVDVTRLEEEGK